MLLLFVGSFPQIVWCPTIQPLSDMLDSQACKSSEPNSLSMGPLSGWLTLSSAGSLLWTHAQSCSGQTGTMAGLIPCYLWHRMKSWPLNFCLPTLIGLFVGDKILFSVVWGSIFYRFLLTQIRWTGVPEMESGTPHRVTKKANESRFLSSISTCQ